jgi:co-chaperonin GroES (HSP10)
MKALHDFVILRKAGFEEERTEAGVIIPETTTRRFLEVVVEEAGPGRLHDGGGRHEMSVSKGDRVLVPAERAAEIDIKGVGKRLLVREGDIIAVLS